MNKKIKSLQKTFVPVMMSNTVQKQSNNPIENSMTTYKNESYHKVEASIVVQ